MCVCVYVCMFRSIGLGLPAHCTVNPQDIACSDEDYEVPMVPLDNVLHGNLFPKVAVSQGSRWRPRWVDG